jgi:cysteine synthase
MAAGFHPGGSRMPAAPPLVHGPTFAEMRDPSRLPADLRRRALAARATPLDPLNLFNLTWKDENGGVRHTRIPPALSGVEAEIVVLEGRHFPTGSHKVGPAYSILAEKQLIGATRPGEHTILCPSTGNFGIGGAWVAPRMNYRCLVVLPEDMSQERYEKIHAYGAQVIKTPGSESNVKEIYDKVHELLREPQNRVVQQFADFGNYRFHYEVTGHAVLDLVQDLGRRGVGDGRVAAFVSAMGSAGTIAAGDLLKSLDAEARIVGLEPVQCPTLYEVGYGAHRIEGIGDKHVTWIHNVLNMDLLLCIDDAECLKGLQLIQEGRDVLAAELGLPAELLEAWNGAFGVSGVCNVLGSIQAARALRLGPGRVVVTVATDGFDRYPSVLRKLDAEVGPMTREEAKRRIGIFRDAEPRWMLAGTPEVRRRWHNQKYFTWVEQQGKSVADLEAQRSPETWRHEQARSAEIDRALLAARAAG